MDLILSAVLVLGAIALVAALVLFGVSKKFAVEEDPRLGQVGELLPGANCGGCGFAGCSGMAAALVKGADAGSIDGLMCPVGGADVMGKVADLLGWLWLTQRRRWQWFVVMALASIVLALPSMMVCTLVLP